MSLAAAIYDETFRPRRPYVDYMAEVEKHPQLAEAVSRLTDHVEYPLPPQEAGHILKDTADLWNEVNRRFNPIDHERGAFILATADCAITNYCWECPGSYLASLQERKRDVWAQNSHRSRRWREETIDASPATKRMIQMKLYPEYYNLIRTGVKTLEGRAYKPPSSKDYPAIWPGDQITFWADPEAPDFRSECGRYDVSEFVGMVRIVGDVAYGPLVHWSFQNLDAGQYFQPGIESTWDKQLDSIGRAARYFAIPGYPGLIAQNGFVGISLKERE